MPFTEMEWVWLLKAEGLTDLDIAERAGGAERTIRSIKKELGRKPSAFEEGLNRVGTEKISLPWSDEAHAQAKRMLDLIRNARWHDLHQSFAFSSKSSVAAALAIDLKSSVSAEDWGHALTAYTFQLGMQFSSLGSHASDREDWEAIVDVMLSLLSGCDDDWAKVLRFKVAGNRIVTAWKRTTPRNDRASEKMKEMIEKSGYREHLIAFNDLVPNDHVAPFNALAIASRFKERERYQDLLARLQRSDDRYQDVKSITDPDFDDDFDDFRKWYAASPKETGKEAA